MTDIFDYFVYNGIGERDEVFIAGFNCAVWDGHNRADYATRDIYDLCRPASGDVWGDGYRTACNMMWLFV